MQSRKELAEAGRRKLEEFRKAKAQGKAATTTPPSKPAQDTAASPPPNTHAAPLSLANGNANGYPASAPASGSPLPPPPPRPAEDAANPQPRPIPNGAPAVTTPPAAPHWEQPPAAAQPAARPAPAVTWTPPSPTASPPITTFVVLADAPIPFGAPAAAPGGQASRTGSSGFAEIPAHGAVSAAPSPSPPGSARWDGGLQGNSDPAAPIASSSHATTPGWPWESQPGAYGRSTVDVGPSGGGGGGGLFDPWGKDQRGQPQPGPTASAAPPLTAGAAAFFDEPPTEMSRSGGSSHASAAAAAPPPGVPPPALAGGQERLGMGRNAGLEALPAARTGFFLWGAGTAGGAAAADPWVAPGATTQPDSTADAPAPVVTGGAEASSGQWPLPSAPDWRLAQAAAAAAAAVEVTPSPETSAAARSGTLAAPSGASTAGYGHAGDAAGEARGADSRPSWLAHTSPVPLSASQHGQPGAAAAVAAPGPGLQAALEPAVATSGAAARGPQDAAPAPGASAGGLGSAAAEAEAATAAAVTAGAITCYDQLSDSYLGAGSEGPMAAGAPDAGGDLGAGAALAAAEDSALARPQPGEHAAAAAASPAPPVSVPSSTALFPGADLSGGYGPAAPGPAPLPVTAPVPPPEQRDLPAPAAPAPAPSRFAWLFGSPPPVKQQQQRQQQTPKEPPSASAPSPQPQPAPVSEPAPSASAQPSSSSSASSASSQPNHASVQPLEAPGTQPPPAPPHHQQSDGAPPRHQQAASAGGETWLASPTAPRPASHNTNADIAGAFTASAGASTGAWPALPGTDGAATQPPPPPSGSDFEPAAPTTQQPPLPSSSAIAAPTYGAYPGNAGPGPAADSQQSSSGAWDSSSGAGLPGPPDQQMCARGLLPGLASASTGLLSGGGTFGQGHRGTAAGAAALHWGHAASPAKRELDAGGNLPWGMAAAAPAARVPVYGTDGNAAVGAGEAAGWDAGGGPAPPPLPSFLRGVEHASTAPVQGLLPDGSAPMSSARAAPWAPPAPSAPASDVPPGGSSWLGPPRDAPAAASEPPAAAFASFSTSFPPPPTSTGAPSGAAAGPPPPSHAAPPPPAPRPPPAAPASSTSAPHFSAAATYLSAYSTAGGAGPAGGGPAAAAATGTSTSSFLESYLDNLLSTMAAPKDVAEDPAAARPGSATATHPARGGAANRSAAATPRHSHLGDAPGAGEAAAEGAGSMGDRAPSTSDVAAGAGGGVALLEGAGGSGRLGLVGEASPLGLPRMDSAVQLRSHHSRRASVDSAADVLSVHSHATGFTPAGGHGHGPAGAGSGVSRAQFAALQQHIDELTEEKLALSRGLQQQTRINEQLAEENEELMRQYNARGAAMEELQRKMKQYEQELEAQALSLEGFSEERHAARSSYAEASSRAQALAAEVVGLEAQVLQLKSGVLKAERAAEEAQQRAKKLEKQVETLNREAQERAQELQQTQLKGRNLVVKLKQTEAKLAAAEEKLAQQAVALMAAGAGPHGLANGHPPPGMAAAAAALPPPPKPTAEQEVQCDLAAELAAAQAARSDADDGAVMAPADGAAAAGGGGDGASVSSGGAVAGAGPGSQLALVRQPSVPSSDAAAIDAPSERLVRVAVDWQAARPQRDAPSAVVAERALASLDSRALRAAARAGAGGGLPEGLDAVALQLARWLPAGPVSGGDPVAVMVEEELRLMQSIHELLGGFEEAQEAAAVQMAELRAHVACLTQENEELRHKLELQTQRLELQMQSLQHGGGHQALSLHQTPAPSGAGVEGGSSTAAMTPVSGPHGYQPAQPFLPAAPPELDSYVVTPTRSTRGTPLPSLDAPGAAAQPAKQTWMGYLFRPRQKKRTRSAIL